ncbi:hypothetical protein, partial [Cyclobacterium xiamenense]|uniref:hypothetical protein n=1 Tax=Cyclobacterium xiamenense TaxID=1297121 RepID=UPI0019D64878
TENLFFGASFFLFLQLSGLGEKFIPKKGSQSAASGSPSRQENARCTFFLLLCTWPAASFF